MALPPYTCNGNCSICECAVTGWPCNAGLFLLSPQGRIQIENGALSIAALNLSDSGMYQCVAENKHGVIYSSAQLMVLGEIAYIPPLLSCLSVCVWSSPKIQPSSLVWISSATILQTLLLSVETLPAKIWIWWSVSFYFNSFCDIDLDTTDALLCGFVQAF